MTAYGFCPECGAPGISRERRPEGNDRCANGHVYKSSGARIPPAQPQPMPYGGLQVGDLVHKHSGEARWYGIIVDVYPTLKGGTRYAVDVLPQGFQMVATGAQLCKATWDQYRFHLSLAMNECGDWERNYDARRARLRSARQILVDET